MRFVLVDEDNLITSIIEAMLNDLGHEVVGVVDTTADAEQMIRATRPEVVIADLSLGYNSDFDPVAAALEVGARVVVFAYNADDAILSRYAARPVFVAKPDLSELERVVGRLEHDTTSQVLDVDRRVRPSRPANGPKPTSLADAQAFYEALNEALEGDALLAIDLLGHQVETPDGAALGRRVQAVLREGDRLLASSTSLKIFLPGAGEAGVTSLLGRLEAAGGLAQSAARSVVIGPGEAPSAAFDRLQHAGL